MGLTIVFLYISICSVLIPLTYSLVVKRKMPKDKLLTALIILFCSSLITEACSEVYIRTGHEGTLILNIFFVIQFLLMSYIYRLLLAGKYANLINTVLVVFLAYCIGVIIFSEKQEIHAPQKWAWIIGSIIIVSYGALHIFRVFKTVASKPPIHQHGPLWVSIAFIVYFSFSAGVFLISDQVFSGKLDPATAMTMWNFHNFYYIIRNILLTVAIHRKSKEKKGIDHKKYGEQTDWWKTMKPNPDRDKEINIDQED